MSSGRPRTRGGTGLSPAFVVALLALLVTLSGSAIAASKLISSGGVKNNSLKSADLKNGAGVKGADVVDGTLKGADVAAGGLTGGDVADDSLSGADVSEASLAVARVVARLGGPSGQALTAAPTAASVPNLAYTQPADESDSYIAGGVVTFGAGCTGARTATVTLVRNGFFPTPENTVGTGTVTDSAPGARTRRVELTGSIGTGPNSSFRSGSPQNQQFVVLASATCGGGSGVTLDSFNIDVTGYR